MNEDLDSSEHPITHLELWLFRVAFANRIPTISVSKRLAILIRLDLSCSSNQSVSHTTTYNSLTNKTAPFWASFITNQPSEHPRNTTEKPRSVSEPDWTSRTEQFCKLAGLALKNSYSRSARRIWTAWVSHGCWISVWLLSCYQSVRECMKLTARSSGRPQFICPLRENRSSALGTEHGGKIHTKTYWRVMTEDRVRFFRKKVFKIK